MKSAKELYQITLAQTPMLVEKVLDGVREHIIESCERDAKLGAVYYTIHLKRAHGFIKEELLKECIKLAKEFEKEEYKVCIEDTGNGYYVNFSMTFSWNGQIEEGLLKRYGKRYHLYDTDNGIDLENVSIEESEISEEM